MQFISHGQSLSFKAYFKIELEQLDFNIYTKKKKNPKRLDPNRRHSGLTKKAKKKLRFIS